MIDLTKIVLAALGLLGTVITTVLVPYLKARLSAQQLEQAKVYARLAVEAAEMLYRESGKGAEKKAYVQQYLAEHGYTLDTEQLDVLIESAVLEMKNHLGGAA